MRTLILFRHAKSSWEDTKQTDHERPLNARGIAAAGEMGRVLVEHGLWPELIYCSTARRAVETLRLAIADGFHPRSGQPVSPEIRLRGDLYHATPAVLEHTVASVPADVSRVMFIGHNPGFEAYLEQVTEIPSRLPTASIAVIEWDTADWPAAARSRGRLKSLWLAKDLPNAAPAATAPVEA